MTINIKNFLNDKSKLSKMGEFQSLKQIEGLEMASVSADLYNNGRDDLTLFYFKEGANYATVTTTNSIISESIAWNNNSHKKNIKGLMVNTKNANTFTGKQGKESIDILAKNLSRILTIKESKSKKGTSETVKIKDLIFDRKINAKCFLPDQAGPAVRYAIYRGPLESLPPAPPSETGQCRCVPHSGQ